MTRLLGFTRSCLRADHALITPDTHVVAPLAGWLYADGYREPSYADGVIHISPRMGARFVQYTVHLRPDTDAIVQPVDGVGRFLFLVQGQARLEIPGDTGQSLDRGGFAYLPPGSSCHLRAGEPTTLAVFEKAYQPLVDSVPPAPIVGHQRDVPGEPFQGDTDARLQTLLPSSCRFDMAVNLFTYQPGAALPQVEVHVMEHGLLMLDGAGIYRLGDQWYSVQAGDVIWMAPYCPQWFAAVGKEPARYLYYKDVNREPRHDWRCAVGR